jgi:glycosyltransferase involved in cell wall biosynthesis
MLEILIFREPKHILEHRPEKFVSVIIPVLNDSERLATCLEALENQTYPIARYEVIVVDNGSDEDIDAVVERFDIATAAFDRRVGSYAARNKGVSLARGEILAFTDSDCTPNPDWIEKGVQNLLTFPDVGFVGGKVEFLFKKQQRPNAYELYDSIASFRQKDNIENYNFSVTANLFTFKSVFQHVGPFNDTLKSGGDREWGQRVHSSGYKLVYAENACVAHPARSTLLQLTKKAIRVTGGLHELKNNQGNSFFSLFKHSGLIPPLRKTYHLIINKRLSKKREKIKVILIHLVLNYVKAYETIRLQLGMNASRT